MFDPSEAAIEQDAMAVFATLGYQTANCWGETFGPSGALGRQSAGEVILTIRLRAALARLNPSLQREALDLAHEELTRERSTLSPAQANREIYRLLKDGIRVTFRAADGPEEIEERVQVIDWRNPEHNDFFLASQFKIAGDLYPRRADLVAFVNGIPLVFIELKASHVRIEDAYTRNLRDYRETIPRVFWYNALIILSNASKSRVGSITSPWGHFAEWKRTDDESGQRVVSLETTIRGVCAKSSLLDLVENFTLFQEAAGGLVKVIGKNHQYRGVNQAIEAVNSLAENRGRLGVFWHTQGSGKSFSMVFFTQKILRTLPGNRTFLILTDRQELDGQIYRTFASVGAVTKKQHEVQAGSGADLKRMLTEQDRLIFSLIQKFRTERGETYPLLSERSDIIVIADEAHRSQYDVFALNMRSALPNAAFIGFTGTPLMAGEERTREVFGDYISIYNFRQSVEDGATVPLYYENRIPELQLTNPNLDRDLEDLVEAADLSAEAQKRLEREFAREYHLITREDRLERIAQDIVAHFLGRGQVGKAMVVSIDKSTTVRMYDKVQHHWRTRLAALEAEQASDPDPEARASRAATIRFMRDTDMAVVVSQAQNEIQDFKELGLDITLHRKRMVNEDLETRFKDPHDALRVVFVCAMWMTGFDVPSLSTIYLDRPMRNHTLMQTIARANRVFEGKTNGLIVDYVGVFRDMQKALAIYGSGESESAAEGESPVRNKADLLAKLREVMADLLALCAEQGIAFAAIRTARGFTLVRLLDGAVESLLARGQVPAQPGDAAEDNPRLHYLALYNAAGRLYSAVLPDPDANEFNADLAVLTLITRKLRAVGGDSDEEYDAVMADVAKLLDASIAADGYTISAPSDPTNTSHRIDLSRTDFEALKAAFSQGRKRTEAERLKAALRGKLREMVRRNASRVGLMQKLQRLIDEYNSGAAEVDAFFAGLLALAAELAQEEARTTAEQLSEEELAVFDLVTAPAQPLSTGERERIKKGVRDLLAVLKQDHLGLDWRKRPQSRALVRTTIEETLDQALPPVYTTEVFQQVCDTLYQHVFDSYYGQGRSIYDPAA